MICRVPGFDKEGRENIIDANCSRLHFGIFKLLDGSVGARARAPLPLKDRAGEGAGAPRSSHPPTSPLRYNRPPGGEAASDPELSRA